MAVKEVVATVEDPETKETIVVHVDRLAFSSPRLRHEIVSETFVVLMFLSVLFRILRCMIFLAKDIWTNLLCLRLRQYMPLPLRLAR